MIQVEKFVKLLRQTVQTPSEMMIQLKCEESRRKISKKKSQKFRKAELMVGNVMKILKTCAAEIGSHDLIQSLRKPSNLASLSFRKFKGFNLIIFKTC